MSVLMSSVLALLLDWRLGESKHWHPLVGFGNLAYRLEAMLNSHNASMYNKLAGIIAWTLAVLPLTALAVALELNLQNNAWLSLLVSALILYVAIGWQSLMDHAQRIYRPLKQGNLPAARQALSYIVSRDTNQLNESQIASAATESVLENGADAVFGAIFWFLIAGIPGVVLYRLCNTLDAMWGYKNPRFIAFGWCAARMDDVLNLIPARLTALSYTLGGKSTVAWRSWRRQAGNWKSPNAGPVMAAGAGALHISLGGDAPYHGTMQARPQLGEGPLADAESISQACQLVHKSLLMWLLSIGLLAWLGVWQ